MSGEKTKDLVPLPSEGSKALAIPKEFKVPVRPKKKVLEEDDYEEVRLYLQRNPHLLLRIIFSRSIRKLVVVCLYDIRSC